MDFWWYFGGLLNDIFHLIYLVKQFLLNYSQSGYRVVKNIHLINIWVITANIRFLSNYIHTYILHILNQIWTLTIKSPFANDHLVTLFQGCNILYFEVFLQIIACKCKLQLANVEYKWFFFFFWWNKTLNMKLQLALKCWPNAIYSSLEIQLFSYTAC